MIPVTVGAETPEQKGLEIAREADRRDNGWNDSESTLIMILRNRHGDESKRELRGKALEVQGDGDKTLTIFDTPKDVKGTAFLNFTHKVGDDDQWLFLPALKRVKRIASRNKSGSFMGSEFAYEDIASQEIEKYSYKWLRDENYQGRECFVVESYPIDKKYSGYTRLVSWIDKAEYRSWKIEFYDRKKSHFKTLTFKSYRQYLNKYWRPDEMNMVNHQNGKNTQLIWGSYRFRTGLTERDFTKNSLKRAK
ncbi:outer membrane lipoprotein-sorting protein [Photobacterium sagamiensis]